MPNAEAATPLVDGSPPPVTDRVSKRQCILFVINSLGGGGAERSLAGLLPYVEDAGFRPVVACFQRRREGAEAEVRRSGVDLRFLEERTAVGRIRRLRRLISSESVDLVHTTIFESDLAGRIAAAGTGVPLLTSLVNTSYDPIRLSDPNVNRWALTATRLLDGWTARHFTTHFHAITHAVKHASVEALGIPATRITVIERGRDPDRLGSPGAQRRGLARRRLGLEEDDEVIVNVGRQDFQKGQRYLVEAMARLAPARPRLILLLVGRTGHASERLDRQVAELGVEKSVRFLGHRDDVPEILAAADLFVFPSLYEGQGGALVEAMGMGLPIVASDIPSTREVVGAGRNARLVPVGSGERLTEEIHSLLDDPAERLEMARRSREAFLARFTLERSATRMIQLYRSLLDR